MQTQRHTLLSIPAVLTLIASGQSSAAQPPAPGAGGGSEIEEIVVYGVTPSDPAERPRDRIPRFVQSASGTALARAPTLDLTRFMQHHLASVSINSAQNNPLQPDLQFRGFTASPLLGLPQGLAVYVDGARVNEPLGDAVNWDLIPASIISRMSLIGGSDPLFGLNSLGGAFKIDTKTGFDFQSHQAELHGGSHHRISWTVESGGNDGAFGYYANVSRFEEDGWRDLSPSDALSGYLSLGWRGEATALDLGVRAGNTDLTGNGAVPVGLLELDRTAIFTAPDVTENDELAFTLEGSHQVNGAIRLFGSAFHRHNETRSFNGDASEFTVCRLGSGQRLLEGVEEDDLEDAGIALEDVCDGRFAHADALGEFLSGLEGEEIHLEDLTDSLSGRGELSGEAINNRSRRDQESRGFDVALEVSGSLFGLQHELVTGVRHYRGEAEFDARVELARLDPVTRSTAGLGLGTFVDAELTHVTTTTESWSVYLLDMLTVTDRVHLTLGGRLDDTRVEIRDRSGIRPEVEGDHDFDRFNPSIGVTWQVVEQVNAYVSYAESSRAPTPIELTCNETVFEQARARADDPDDVDFECRLPNAFVADPPLDQVVTESVELGLRGVSGGIGWHAGLFHQINEDDIVFQTTGRATGLFGAIDRTRRRGLELSAHGQWQALSWFAAYTHLDATFEDDFDALSPSHPLADDDGRIRVSPGDRIPGLPEHQLKLGAGWQATERLSAGADVVHYSGSHLRGDEINALDDTGGFTLVDLRVAYRVNEHVEAFGRVSNLLDEAYENFGLIAEDPGEVLPDLEDSRALFLAPGPPRAGWVGVRVRL